MDCRTFHRQLEDYLEGGLDFPARFGMDRHAKQCFACEKNVSEAINLSQMARELGRVGAPADFDASLLARIHAEKARRRIWHLPGAWFYGWDRHSWRTLTAVAATVVLVAGAISLLQYGILFYRDTPAPLETVSRSGVPAVDGSANGTAAGFEQPFAAGGGVTDVGNFPERTPAINFDGAGFLGHDPWATPFSEPGDSDYVEFLVPVAGDRQLVLRLPRTIRMRYDQPSQDYFIRNVSH